MLKRYIQHIRSLKFARTALSAKITGMLLLLAIISQAQVTTGYIVKGGLDTGPFSGGVLIGTTSKINYALTEQRILIDEKPGILEGSWKDITGVIQTGSSLTKNSSDGWGNAGAASNSSLDILENGWLQYKVSSLSNTLAFGFSTSNTDAHYNTINYAVMIDAGQLYVYNQGQLMGNFGTVANNDFIRISRIGNILFYTKNGDIFFNQNVDIEQTIITDIALYSQGMALEIESSFVESATGCDNAIAFTGINTCMYNNVLSGSETWFSFVAEMGDIDIILTDNSVSHDIGTIDWYEGGGCGSLNYKGSVIQGNDGTISFIAANLIIGNKYYLRVIRNNNCINCTENINFDLCLRTYLASTCNPINNPCNLIQNPGFELGTIPVAEAGIRDNYADCWTTTPGGGGANTPDVMDILGPPGFVNCFPPGTGAVGIPNNYYSNGVVNLSSSNSTSTQTRYACMYPNEGIKGVLSPAATNKVYYMEFWGATSNCYTSYPATVTVRVGGQVVTAPVAGSGSPSPGAWSKNSLCFDLTGDNASSFSNIEMEYNAASNTNRRYFFDDFKVVQLADAGPDISMCSGSSTPIGPQCPISNSNVTYSWFPTAGLSNPNIANPTANPLWH
ncbi:MAG: hypothetical protein WAQ28_02985 [Bacteroidia bacterium]